MVPLATEHHPFHQPTSAFYSTPPHSDASGISSRDPDGPPSSIMSYSPPPPRTASRQAMSTIGGHAGQQTAQLPQYQMEPVDPRTVLGDEQERGSRVGEGESTKRSNPLVDLMESEARYVEELSLAVKKVAAAWSRENFPPKALDAMFRCVEAVYKTNRNFGGKLQSIGPNPTSPKILGDMLMQWIDDLEGPYQRYCSTYMTGFDRLPSVANNTALHPILDSITLSLPPSPPSTSWTVDLLFLLPYNRLTYYTKLYSRLLRSTKEGRSDHKLLVAANERLGRLMASAEERLHLDINEIDVPPARDGGQAFARDVKELAKQGGLVDNSTLPMLPPKGPPTSDREGPRESVASSRGSSNESRSNSIISPFNSRIDTGDRTSGASASTSAKSGPTPANSPGRNKSATPVERSRTPPLSDLEVRLDASRAIDLFTMRPKACRLQMSPPNLSFSRHLRGSVDATIHFTPTSTGQEVVHSRAHIYVLTDLFLMCERMTLSEKDHRAEQVAAQDPSRAADGGPFPEMWLLYPPLAGRHLTVIGGATEDSLIVTVMGRERFLITLESRGSREDLLRITNECTGFVAPDPRSANVSPLMPQAVSPSMSNSGGPIGAGWQPSPFSPLTTGSSGSSTFNDRLSTDNQSLLPLPSRTSSSPGINAPPPRGASLRTAASSGRLQQSYNSDQQQQPHGQIQPGGFLPRSSSTRSASSGPPVLGIPGVRSDVPPLPGPGQYQNGVPQGPSAYRAPSPNANYNGNYSGNYNGNGYPQGGQTIPRSRSAEPMRPRVDVPYHQQGPPNGYGPPSLPMQRLAVDDDSPPASPIDAPTRIDGPATISAQMKCKVFLKQSHQQWKSLGSAKLRLYVQPGSNVKQLVVEADSSSKAMLISTIVLTDGVERVAKTGVAVELSDKGARTGIIYMIQLRNEASAQGLFESLLAGSDRAGMQGNAR